jgi:outer membrane beta-barrel protein
MRKNQAGVGLSVALALLLAPLDSFAQGKKGAAKAEEAAEESAEPATDSSESGESGADAGGDEGGSSSLEELCKIDPENCVKVDMDAASKRDIDADMYAVQQIWALRAKRFEINPYVGVTMNDQFVAHPGPGIGLNYYFLHWLAAGVNANVYAGMNSESDFNFETSRAARVGQPITEYQWNANANVTFVPAYGKFAAFSNFIFHYDFYFTLGAGAVSTRPIAVVDPDNRTFAFSVKPTFGGAMGIRIFFTRYLAAMLEVRDYIFWEDLENPSIATGFNSAGRPLAQDPSTWLAPDSSFTNNVQAQLGLSVFLPFSWSYVQAK